MVLILYQFMEEQELENIKLLVDYDAIKAMKEAISIPVIANGDIKDYDKS